MSNMSLSEDCICPSDCDTNYYTYSISSTKLESESICRKQRNFFGRQELTDLPMFMRNYEALVSAMKAGTYEVCLRSLERMAYVNFQLGGKNVMRFKKELRVTLADQVANLGGTVGLFTGMSILSFCEIVFWLARLVLGIKPENK